MYRRGDSPEPEDLEAYRILDPSRYGSPTNEDEIVTAGEGQALIHREGTEMSLACALEWKPLMECLPTKGRVPAVARRKHTMVVR